MDYQCKTRSNYFAIREGREAKLKALLDHCGLRMWKENDPYGVTRYAFGVDGDFVGIPYRGTIPEEDPDGCGGDRNAFFRELQAVISEDDAVIIQEVGTEALRYATFYDGSHHRNLQGSSVHQPSEDGCTGGS